MTAEGSPQTFEVFNLEFPSWCDRIEVRGYTFGRVEDYPERLLGLQHLVNVTSEFTVQSCTGSHQITARVSTPDSERPAVFSRDGGALTELDDILLLLSVFVGRDVFKLWGEDDAGNLRRLPTFSGQGAVLRDPRQFRFGGVLRTSVPYTKTPGGTGSSGFFDSRIKRALTHCIEVSRGDAWQQANGGGRFLFLFRDAMAAPRIESAFTLCWTMWEHLFAVRNKDKADPRRVTAKNKILFVLKEILGLRRDNKLPARVTELVRTRDRLVHFGELPEKSEERDALWYLQSAKLFVELSDMVVVRLLELGKPSNLFNTQERLEHWVATGEHPNLTELAAAIAKKRAADEPMKGE